MDRGGNELVTQPSLYARFGLKEYPIPYWQRVDMIREPPPEPVPSTQPANTEAIKRTLSTSSGIIFIDKASQTIPDVIVDEVLKVFPSQSEEIVNFVISSLRGYLQGNIIIGGQNDAQRNEWIKRWNSVYRNGIFNNIYNNNQLKRVKMSSVWQAINLIHDEIPMQHPLYFTLDNIQQELTKILEGQNNLPSYSKLSSNRQKLAVVSVFELASAACLKLLKGEQISLRDIQSIFDTYRPIIYPKENVAKPASTVA